MSKQLEILDDLKSLQDESLISLIGGILTVAEDVAYAYDISEEMFERLKEVFDDHEIKCKVVDDDPDQLVDCYDCKHMYDCERTYLGACTDGEEWSEEDDNATT